ncbi:MAG: sulfite exporter TauE/SafE family protein [Chloroflexi bacterium]|nr:sulfite exporter TauE/SafE family protein [Chloroflexota bacterium]MCH8799836.1 sulfite exporter TauE/SafE family protein [Chloroflexota bacterium]MCI0790067.1 sulfite exporter TauE/SafE family protein [Chloroflexota bacterium]MCI0801812.1 sulfite exporter TauE/SafE family protein [Chloroflexota bacterium]MCI0810278.1 sulfite exporter TauE/SafE family protein [Chloroflexota bacterium]
MDATLGWGSDVLVWNAVVLTVVSLAVGVLGGFVGLALGTMRLPAMLLMGLAAPTAGGTNILVSSISSIFGAIRHLREGRVNFRLVLIMGGPAFAGAFVGGFLGGRVSESILLSAAGILVLWQGVELRMRGRAAAGTGDEFETTYTGRRLLLGGGMGLGVGLLGGAVGLILGSIRLPALIRILKVDPRIAAGTNLVIGFVMGSLGWVGHALRGQVDYQLLLLMGAGAAVGSYYGAKLTGKVDLATLIAAMGYVLVAVGAILIWRGVTA